MDQESVNPLVPAVYDVVWSIALVVPLALLVAAAISVLRSPRYTGGGKLLWVVVLVVVPVLGPLGWFAAGRTAQLRTDVP